MAPNQSELQRLLQEYEKASPPTKVPQPQEESTILTHLGHQEPSTFSTWIGERVRDALLKRNQRLSIAETCTGGRIGDTIHNVSGASAILEGGGLFYGRSIKNNTFADLEAAGREHGSVSEPVVRIMADELRKQTETDWALALSGISGPTGGSPEKPVGTVHIAIAGPERKTIHRRIQLEPKTRAEYKTLATAWALALLLKEIEQAS